MIPMDGSVRLLVLTVNFLPASAAAFCGEDGSLAFMSEQFTEQLDASIQMAIDVVRDTCNDPEMTAFMDCSTVSILISNSFAVPTSDPPSTDQYSSAVVSCTSDDYVTGEECGCKYTAPTTT